MNYESLYLPDAPLQEFVINPPIIEEEKSDEICIRDECEVPKCTSQYLEKSNYLSEFLTSWEKHLVRQNLGISDSFAIAWGNIEGNLLNQKDLYKFVNDQIESSKEEIFKEIEDKLANVTPSVSSDINANPSYVTPEGNDIIVTWSYPTEITEQSINGIPLNNSVRTYTFANQTKAFTITLQYVSSGVTNTLYKSIPIKYYAYYGSNLSSLSKTLETSFSINTNGYVYLLLPYQNAIINANGFIGGFSDEGTTVIGEVTYYIYKSVNNNLGNLYIKYGSQ